MTREQKIEMFNKELDYIQDANIRKFAETAISGFPDYFFEVPASSSGKFHSALESGFGGLVYHTKSVAKVANYLINLDQYRNKLSDEEADCIIVAALCHDGIKHGPENKTGYSVFDHPNLASEYVRNGESLDGIIDDKLRNIIADAVASHSGQWNTSKRSKVVLPTPQTLIQELVHLSDYMASRGDIHILFEEDEIKIELPDPHTYVMNFGKHNGLLLEDVVRNHHGYIDWMRENNISREPLMTLVKQLEDEIAAEEEDEI